MKGNGNAIGSDEDDPTSLVMTSPKVHRDVVSIFTWYSFRQIRKTG